MTVSFPPGLLPLSPGVRISVGVFLSPELGELVEMLLSFSFFSGFGSPCYTILPPNEGASEAGFSLL